MHPIVSEQIARFHHDDLLAQAARARLAGSLRTRGTWRRAVAHLAVAAARVADPIALERLVAERERTPARAH